MDKDYQIIEKGQCHPAEERRVLILNIGHEEFDVEKNLKSLNWQCISVNTIAAAIRLIKKDDIKVAIAIISSTNHRRVFDAMTRILVVDNSIQWLAITLQEQLTDCSYVKMLPAYFADYHHQPIDWAKLGNTIGHAYGMVLLAEKHKKELKIINPRPRLLGDSAIMTRLKTNLAKVAGTDGSVLICGETGTGKGVCAELIHILSARQQGPFVTINCAALPPSLIHSELFGHEKGAFTGADKQYIGHIERANTGTLLLDEIGDLPIELQVHLLQFLENQSIERLGGSGPIKVDCQIIFATHINLETAVEEGRFREDLYHRLNILRLDMPSLRERREDIKSLAFEYLSHYNTEQKNCKLTPSALESMLCYDWPGNVRELKNRIQRAVVMAEGDKITECDLGIKAQNFQQKAAGLAKQRIAVDTEVLLDSIQRNNHNISAAARDLNISRTTVYRLMKKCKIKV